MLPTWADTPPPGEPLLVRRGRGVGGGRGERGVQGARGKGEGGWGNWRRV